MTQTVAQYIKDLITEKGGDLEAELTLKGYEHHIGLCYLNLVEFIDTVIEPINQDAIRENLIRLDFANADVFDYLNHLVKGMIAARGLE
jgi:hypothetical protein